MSNQHENVKADEKLFLQGQRVAAGTYTRIDGPDYGPDYVSRSYAGLLPAAVDGGVACYILKRPDDYEA